MTLNRTRKRIIDVARGLEGIIRNNSIHAAAVVIADRPLQEIVPLQLAEDRAAPQAPTGTVRASPSASTRSSPSTRWSRSRRWAC